jgi:putative resolvase
VGPGGQGNQVGYERAPTASSPRFCPTPTVTVLVVEHCDRFTRFGVGRMAASLAARVLRMVVFDAAEASDYLARDFTDGITSLRARPYGRRSAPHRAAMAVATSGDLR